GRGSTPPAVIAKQRAQHFGRYRAVDGAGDVARQFRRTSSNLKRVGDGVLRNPAGVGQLLLAASGERDCVLKVVTNIHKQVGYTILCDSLTQILWLSTQRCVVSADGGIARHDEEWAPQTSEKPIILSCFSKKA